MPFEFIKQVIPDVILIKPRVFNDDRGFFMETYKRSDFEANGIVGDFQQDNYSSSGRGVLRGLHYQLHPKMQGKLVRVISGSVFDVAVDIRKNSPTFGKWVSAILTADNHHMLWVPEGFAHGVLVLEENTHLLYRATNEYSPADDRQILWNDSVINIAWPFLDGIQLSEKDKHAPLLRDAEINF
ncbi:MAG: dTDP-4-dehydrorhamnose 3,5-epimerase [Gammaproteobacteria bacterium RIFCSPHIGHO2_02_FULL_39_13]|nr:MAG: dTDP-4-dehydrorhamnose 3,5-epimerase [Gammaproteobacteria bacterium RIFCSPHIGHO2_02_FULL_39_13]OGT48973.1 MAG: dTDP-4-dehydrorhamnose 3,5-epimerase [Gammaproteobacteria bacterium RIFCSPHIGHO2_12_FULL_39_24]